MKTCKFYGSFFSLLLNYCVLSLEENAVLAVLLAVSLDSIIYDPNSSTRLKNIKRHETELKWIKFLQSPFPLGFNDNIYHEGNISKMPDFDGFFFCYGMIM